MKTTHSLPATLSWLFEQTSWADIICLTALRSTCLETELSFPSSNITMHCPLCTWVIFLTHHQCWWIWKAKNVTIQQSWALGLQNATKRQNSWSTLPSTIEGILYYSGSLAFPNLLSSNFQPSYFGLYIQVYSHYLWQFHRLITYYLIYLQRSIK